MNNIGDFVPKGHMRIARRFNAGSGINGASPEGTAEVFCRREHREKECFFVISAFFAVISTVPSGLYFSPSIPALKRRAILNRPSGTAHISKLLGSPRGFVPSKNSDESSFQNEKDVRQQHTSRIASNHEYCYPATPPVNILTTLFSFSYPDANGAFPEGSLTLGNGGNLYGTTFGFSGPGGPYRTVFKLTTNDTLITLFSFSRTNGANPDAALTLGSDGNFYGITSYGGSSDDGTVFIMATNGALTKLVSFNGPNGIHPQASLTLGIDGNFYGTTSEGGSSGYGTVFRLLLPPVIIVQPKSQIYYAGATVTFLVNATSSSPISFQWQKNGMNLGNGGKISGATNSTLTITGVSANEAAIYSVTVTTLAGSVTSSDALLTVIVPPKLGLQISAGFTRLNLYGMLNSNFVVQYNASLADTNWINLLSLTNLSASPYQFLDPAVNDQPARFYRAFMQ